MKNLSIYLFVVFLGILSACNSLENVDVETVDTTEQITRSASDFEPAVCYGLEEYNNLLKSFEPSPIPSGAPLIYPTYYGGAYVKDTKLVILIAGNPELYREEFVKRCGSENILLEKCGYSYVSLLAQTEKIHEYVMNGNIDGIVGFGIKEDKNMIEIRLKDLNEKTVKELQTKTRSSNMFFFTQGEEIKTEQTSVNSGIEIRNPMGYTSTLGYRVMYNGKKCQTLAGHSFNVGDYVYLPSSLYGICVDKEFYGSVDAAIVEVYSTYEPTNNISYTGMTVSPSVQAVPVGGYVNLYGKTSGNLYGTVTNTNFAGYVENQFMNDIVEVNYTSNSSPGDSGGLVYSSNGFTNYTTGTHIGRLPNTNYSYYTKFQNIQNVFGATRY